LKSYLALITSDLRLAMRQKSVLFFNYLFPLLFLVIFAQFMGGGGDSGGMTRILTLVLILGILGNGLFGAGVRAVQDRESNILRRYKVTPIGAIHILVAQVVTGWLIFMPFVVGIFALAHFAYAMPWPSAMVSILIFATLGILAFRAIGMIIAAAANSMQESQIIVQLIYLPMLLLSGATFPASFFPPWLATVVQFLPATYLVNGFQAMMLRNEGMKENWLAELSLVLTIVVGLFIATKLFRWEKEEKIKSSAKLWILAVLLPFFVLGAEQAHTRQNVAKTQILARQMARSDTYLIRGARIFVGDGHVIESGAVLVKGGKIAEVYDGPGPDPASIKASLVEAAGKTLLPGLIDVHVHLSAPGGIEANANQYDAQEAMLRHLGAYLYSGVTTVRSVGDPLDAALKLRGEVNSGAKLGAELFTCGPMFTAKGGHGTEYFKGLPENIRQQAEAQVIRTPDSPDEARREVDELKKGGVNCIKAILDSGAGNSVFNRLDNVEFQAVAQEAHAQALPLAVHTGDIRDITDALAGGADSIEHGSFREKIPDALFNQMVRQKTYYDPTLSVGEAAKALVEGDTSLLKRSLVQQVSPADLLTNTEAWIASPQGQKSRQEMSRSPVSLQTGKDNLLQAYHHGVMLVTGSDAGNLLVFHGPTVQHEVELWVWAGIPPPVALQAATFNAARLLRADSRIGSIRKGNDADLLLVDGNPLEDISAIERISAVYFKGEHLDRSSLLNPE
jgi:imidazolonepropionase-like amidohydrolase/ABC-type multidrug transport system permease subunit